jgi:hypothetical protein
MAVKPGWRRRVREEKRTETQPKNRRAANEGLSVGVEVHDRHQLELRFNYAVGEAGRSRYFVDAYFFVPRNVGLNRTNYKREDFYADFTALMRIDAAALPLDALGDVNNPESPLSRLAATLRALRTGPTLPPTGPMRVHARLFANLFLAGVRAECRRLEKLLARAERDASLRLGSRVSRAPGDTDWGARSKSISQPRVTDPDGHFEREVSASLGRMQTALHSWRSLRGALWPFERVCHQGVAEAMRSADEYMSLVLDERLAQFSMTLGERSVRYDGSGLIARVQLLLSRFARTEAAHRAHYGYLVRGGAPFELDPDSRDPAERAGVDPGEYYTYRMSLLKKSVQQALYLNVRGSRGDMFVRNAVSAVAAALAAIWALATQVPAYMADLPSSTKALFFTGAVLAYVMKDRIKALTSEALLKRARTYDHAHWIYGESLPDVGIKHFTARSAEAVRFVTSEEVSPDVRSARLQRRTVANAEAAQEEVIHYRKLLEVGADEDHAGLPDGYRIRDILRMNVRHFLVRLDDPVDVVDCYDPKRGTFTRASLAKVYRVNLVVRVRRETTGGEPQERFAHIRLVLNKEGIVRAEQVTNNGVTLARRS